MSYPRSRKAVRNQRKLPLELYDLSTDKGEQRDVAEQQQGIVQRIERYLNSARATSQEYPAEEASWSYPPLDTGYVK